MAVIFNPIHANIEDPRLFSCKVSGDFVADHTKSAWRHCALLEEIPVPNISLEKRVEFAIRCGKAVCKNEQWNRWADNWLSGKNRAAARAADVADIDLVILLEKIK